MNRLRNGILAVLVLFALVVPGVAHAKVVDDARLFNQATITQLDQRISAIKSTYGQDVLVVTVPSLGGQQAPQVAGRYISGSIDNINGVYIFIAKAEKKVDVAVGRPTVRVIPETRKEAIRRTIVDQFRGGNFDAGILSGVGAIEDAYKSSGALPAPVSNPRPSVPESNQRRSGGFGWFGIILLIVGVFVLISIIRAFSQRAVGGGPGGPGYGGVGGGGYGGGYGGPAYGGGGGGFMSSLLGGIGGAVAGNWLYDKFSGRHDGGGSYADSSGVGGGGGVGMGSGTADSDWTSPTGGTGWSSDGGASWGGGSDNSSSWGSSSSSDSGWGSSGDAGFGGSFGDSGGGGSWGDSGGGGGDWS